MINLKSSFQIKAFDSKIDTIDQLISCVCPFKLELVNFFGPLVKTKHVIIQAIFVFPENKPCLFVSAVQECIDLYELDVFISEYCSSELNADLELGIKNSLDHIFISTPGVGKQLFIESNLILDKMKHLFVAAGMRFITNFCDLILSVTNPVSDFSKRDDLKFFSFREFSYAQLNDLFLRSSVNSLDCPEGLKFKNIINVFNSLIYHPFFDANGSQVALFDGQMVGFIFIVRQEVQAEIAYLGVAEEFRSKGIGSALMFETLGLLAMDKVEYLSVIVDEGNFPALNLYLRFGMKRKRSRILFLAEG